MGAIAGTYRYYFDSLVARSGQMQAMALAGLEDLEFPDFLDKDSDKVWKMRKTLEVLKNKDFD